jgi:hypothetical protein
MGEKQIGFGRGKEEKFFGSEGVFEFGVVVRDIRRLLFNDHQPESSI